MPTPHSSVLYVEPNIAVGYDSDESKTWRVKDDFDRSPRLEDYCIAMNIEVEICSRDKVMEDTQSLSEVLILQYKNTDKVGYVNFMGGTKIGGWNFDKEGIKRTPRLKNTPDALTTYYADMYVGDLIDYGTTEMIGIKSVNIDYEKNCVPIINVVFTDVRGLSLFQPTELSRNNAYESIKGINSDNVAQSFFQCFFKMPLPKFTFYIKGFYGEPVAYEVMCDKFETKFNSDTGDFDVNTRFIGYSYSFMTDISLDALLAAPYSDYLGKKYWEEQKENGRFKLPNKNGMGEVDMPTIVEIAELFTLSNPESAARDSVTPLTEEEKTHSGELAKLSEIRDKSRSWYESLYSIVCNIYGKEKCFDFMTSGGNGEYYRILILTNDSSPNNMRSVYEQFPDEFKQLNLNLFNLLTDFNNDTNSFKKITNVSTDFSAYSKIPLFKGCEVMRDGKIRLIGFSNDCPINLTEVRDRLFNYKEKDANGIESNNNISDRTLKVIYNDGKNQRINAYLIDFDYLALNRRINSLNADAEKSQTDKEKEASRKAYNEAMIRALGWYPTVENFTKIMMAHLETFMHMMYTNASEIINDKRTAASLGVSAGDDGNITDTNNNDEFIPPFPRVTKTVVGDDNITRKEDEWVGSFVNGVGFKEADLIDGLFNGIDEVQSIITSAKKTSEMITDEVEISRSYTVDYPLTPYDFFLKVSPYGSSNEDLDNINALLGRIAIRMFDVLCLSGFKWGSSTVDVTKVAWAEANNCFKTFTFSSNKLRKLLGTSEDSSSLNADAILGLITSEEAKPIAKGDSIPWKEKNSKAILLNPNDMWLERYRYEYKNGNYGFMYPVHGGSFTWFDKCLELLKKGSGFRNDNSINISYVDDIYCYSMKTNVGNNDSIFNNVFITDDHKLIAEHLEHSLTISTNKSKNDYSELGNAIAENSVNYYGNIIESFISQNGVFKQKIGLPSDLSKTSLSNISTSDENLFVKNVDSGEKIYYEGKGIYASEAENGVFNMSFINEAKGYKRDGEFYCIDKNKSLFYPDTNKVGGFWGSLKDLSKENKMQLFVMSLDCIDYKIVSDYMNSDDKRILYLPKLAVLQIGAAAYEISKVYASNKKTIALKDLPKHIVMSESFKTYGLKILGKLSNMAKIGYANYFLKWASANASEVEGNLVIKKNESGQYISNKNYAMYYHSGGQFTRALFNESSPYIQRLTNDLMKLTLVVKGTLNYNANVTRKGHAIDMNIAKVYLDAFINRLRELYGLKEEDTIDNNGIIKLAKTPSKTTIDMRKELYRYLKQIYDKWIPTTPLSHWKYETFFETDKEDKIQKIDGGGGHLFHFIDSYYNKIGNRLLINPKKLTEKILSALNATDINTMMLGFMADIFAQNKCMLICMQNFLDLSDKASMSKMFTPLPYNEMRMPRKHPDFVVVYPYEPSKNLNINNSEFKDDTFMLNDETQTPIAIKSRGDNEGRWHMIPAFGVSYGKQYQSYFKNIDINMSSPIATQQSIMAKHSILRQAQNSTEKSVVAQDIYDIYSTQSYMCTVEMMGCAWVQPLMYFVLTNVPMFRGSYMIMKVSHSITPGNMTTRFTGCRMANSANKLIEDIFTDDADSNGQPNYLEERRNNAANVDNDCHYKVFPVLGSSSMDVSPNASAEEKAMVTMRILASHGFTTQAAAGVCGNIHVESAGFTTDAKGRADNKGSYGLCQWHSSRKDALMKMYGSTPSLTDQVNFVLYELGIIVGKDGKKCPYKEYFTCASVSGMTNIEAATRKFCDCFENPKDRLEHYDRRIKLAERYYKLYVEKGASTNKSQPSKDVNEDGLYNAFFSAIQQTSNSSPQINVQLKQGFANVERDEKKKKIMTISKDGGNDKLGMIFDVILNEHEYYQYVQELWWVYAHGGEKSSPIHVDVLLSNSVNQAKRVVYFAETKKVNEVRPNSYGDDTSCVNDTFLKSIYKKYRGKNNEIPQFSTNDIFKDMKVQDCDDVIGGNENGSGVGGKLMPSMKIENWDAGKAANFLIQHALSSSANICAFAVQQAVIAGGIECTSGGGYKKALNLLATNHWELISSGKTNSSSFKTMNPSVGDILGMTRGNDYGYVGHVCMYCGNGNGWYSDYKQTSGPYVYNKYGPGNYWLIRYKGGAKSVNQKPLICYKKDCLKS